MKKLSLYNSLFNKEEEFVPLNSGCIRMYVCGPTVYDSPHIGNARPLVVFDILYRILKLLYKEVIYVRNITDVDDKINKKAIELSATIKQITDKSIELFQNDLIALNILPVNFAPRVTEHMQDIINFIQKLLDNGFAYESDGHILYDVRKNDQYGILSKRKLDDMIAGSRVEIASYKKDPLDFVLWKPSEKNVITSWPSPWGSGRPGWHIECSALSYKYLGEQFDIHGGGQDLIFPHHENEIAQNYGACNCLMANFWVHNNMLVVDNCKMSKSLGNVVYVKDLLAQNISGEVIRYVFLSTHYQKILNWTVDVVASAKNMLNRLYLALDRKIDGTNNLAGFENFSDNDCNNDCVDDLDCEMLNCLLHNMNTYGALSALHKIADQIFKCDCVDQLLQLQKKLLINGNFLGILRDKKWFRGICEIDCEKIEQLILKRKLAKVERNYKLADEIRQMLLDDEIVIEDGKDGATTWRKL